MAKLTREEMETHISLDAVEGIAIIDTSIPKDINKCKKMGYEIIKENFYDDGSVCNVVFRVPRRCISFRKNEKRVVSEEQRERMRERAKMHGFGRVIECKE
jgi:hypothetical protein